MRKSALQPLVYNDSRILILGTMPGEKSIQLQQYYGNRGNRFWKIMFEVFDETFSTDYDVRKELLKKKKIALWNVLESCEREGSQDQKIKNEKANDFPAFFETFPNIKFVFFESKTAAKFYMRHTLYKVGVQYSTLPSTSGLNAGSSHEEKVAEWKQVAAASNNVTLETNTVTGELSGFLT
ncbi:MAG: DNA-deoxyinosine glycosylase [Flavobacterium sp.]|nr:MAG: DNA-deoxyinosine glycosylase [Flavobacterium sp.]